MADVSWVKISTGIPDHRKIKRIRKMPDGNNIILFWVFLLARAGESNHSGGLYMTDTLPYSIEDLSADFDFTTEFVEFSLITLEKYGMITRYDEIIFIKNWEEYQSVEGMEKIKAQNRIRKQQQREREKKILLGKNQDSSDMSRDSHVTVTPCHATDIDKELDIDKDINNSRAEKVEKIPYSEIIDYLNQKASKNFKVVQKHKDFIKARWNEGQRLNDFKQVIDNMVVNWTGQNFNGKPAEAYLQPSTLFGNKFDQYLNQTPKKMNSLPSDYDDLGF